MRYCRLLILFLLFLNLGGLFSVSSAQEYVQRTNLPTIYIETYNKQAITSKENYIYATMYYVDESGIQQYDSLQIRGRGNSTWNLAKKPYRIKFNKKERILGEERANAKSWTLLANFADKTLIRNAVTSCIGDFLGQPFTAAAQFVDLVLNGTYLGNYQLSDQMEVRKKRVHITEQEEVLPEDADISGGYLVEVDGFATGEPVYFRTNKNILITIKSPDSEVIVNSQKNYIKNYFQEFENALFSTDFADKDKGYRPYVDSLTLASWYLATELSANVDGFWSTYMYKEQGDPKLYWGPLWDYDIAYNNCNRVGDVTNALMLNKGFGSDLTKVWMLQMWKDPWFVRLINRTWKEAVGRGLEEHVINHIDSLAALLEESQMANFQKWRINQRVYNELVLFSTYQEGVEYLKTFIRNHIVYLTKTFEQAAADMGEVLEETPEFELDETFYYRILNKGNGNSIDVIDGATGTICTWAPNTERETQMWEILDAGDGYYQLVNASSGLAITDVAQYASGSYQTGSTLTQQTLVKSNTRQQWKFVPMGTENSYVIANRLTNLAMNNSGNNANNGNNVLSWKNDADNPQKNTRQWRIEKYEPKPVDAVEEAPVHACEYAVFYRPEQQDICFAVEEGGVLSGTARIYSMEGREMMRFDVNETVNVAVLPEGIYLLRWEEAGRTYSVKFVKR